MHSQARRNHFREWLNTALNSHIDSVPPNVVERVRGALDSGGMPLTPDSVKSALKTMHQHMYVDRALIIWAWIEGVELPTMTSAQSDRVVDMFADVVRAYEQLPVTDQLLNSRHFLANPYCAYKLCQLCGYTNFLPMIHVMWKTRDDVIDDHDRVWARVCAVLGWSIL